MKIAVLADIHANLPALIAVIRDAQAREVDHFICLGDIVGYGPHPEECVSLVRKLNAPTVLGNHDAWVVKNTNLHRLEVSPTVIPGLFHARAAMSRASKAWLRTRPLTARFKGVSLVHASFHRPSAWDYQIGSGSAHLSLKKQPTRIAFFGHTHQAGVWFEHSDTLFSGGHNEGLLFRPTIRYAINPGSVGNPRTPANDPDPRAQYAIYDASDASVLFFRVPYDLASYVRAIRESSLPEEMISRIKQAY